MTTTIHYLWQKTTTTFKLADKINTETRLNQINQD